MNEAVLKTLVLVLLILLGIALKAKFKMKDQINGIKEIVLSVALPSTIFIALMKIHLDASLLFLPILALAFNFIIFLTAPYIGEIFGIKRNSSSGRTIKMLLPSLAPGLSCFPFIIEFLGEESLAMAAMADVGNKFFGLIFLYFIAMNMYMSLSKTESANTAQKVKSLLLSLVKEPINIILFTALMLLILGWNYSTLPAVITGFFDRTSAIMTPLVLIFIGLAVKLKQKNKSKVFCLLLFRAGLSLTLSALAILVLGLTDPTQMLLITVFPLSSISFWPFAHMSVFQKKEEELSEEPAEKTFDIELAIMMLAISLPMSTVLILAILTAGDKFASSPSLLLIGFVLMVVAALPFAIARISRYSGQLVKSNE